MVMNLVADRTAYAGAKAESYVNAFATDHHATGGPKVIGADLNCPFSMNEEENATIDYSRFYERRDIFMINWCNELISFVDKLYGQHNPNKRNKKTARH